GQSLEFENEVLFIFREISYNDENFMCARRGRGDMVQMDIRQHRSQRVRMLRRGMTVGIPSMLGYVPIAITSGVLAKEAGMSLVELSFMSILVYAGASQFMAANMIAVGAGAMEIIIATFVLNFRHFVMSLSFTNRLRSVGINWKAPLTLGLTDESFAVS